MTLYCGTENVKSWAVVSAAQNGRLCQSTWKYEFHLNCLEHSIRMSLTATEKWLLYHMLPATCVKVCNNLGRVLKKSALYVKVLTFCTLWPLVHMFISLPHYRSFQEKIWPWEVMLVWAKSFWHLVVDFSQKITLWWVATWARKVLVMTRGFET